MTTPDAFPSAEPLVALLREAAGPGAMAMWTPAELDALRVWSSHLWTRTWTEQERRAKVGVQ